MATTKTDIERPIKAWAFGNNSEPNAVIDALLELGAHNPYEMDGKGENNIYFTDADDNICMYGPEAVMERELLTTHPGYREVLPNVTHRNFAVKVTCGEKTVIGVLKLHPIYDHLIKSMGGTHDVSIDVHPFDEKKQSCWIDLDCAPILTHEHVLCKMEDGTIISGILARTETGMRVIADNAVEVINNSPKYWMPIPE